MIEQITMLAFASFGSPKSFRGIDRGGREDHMDMGMVTQPPGVGVQHRCRPWRALELLVVLAEGMNRLPGASGHQGIDRSLMPPSQRSKLCRQGKGQQEIVRRQLLVELALNPLLALMRLAVGTAAMATGVRHKGLMMTGIAGGLHFGTEMTATSLHGCQRLAM